MSCKGATTHQANTQETVLSDSLRTFSFALPNKLDRPTSESNKLMPGNNNKHNFKDHTGKLG